MNKAKIYLLKLLFAGGFGIVLITSLFNLYDNKDRFLGKLDIFNSSEDKKELKKFTTDYDKYWFNELKNGGYIIYMRHAERNKWLDTSMYDAAETSEARRGENEYFADFVCLNKRGKVQAQMINEFINKHGMKVGNVISSPSCRARQTAEIAFNKLDAENKVLVYQGVFTQDYDAWQENLRKLLLNIPIQSEKNTIITAHGSSVYKNLFDNKEELEGIDIPRKVNEGGFYVISRNNGELKFEHQFTKFTDFSIFIHKRN